MKLQGTDIYIFQSHHIMTFSCLLWQQSIVYLKWLVHSIIGCME